MYDIFWAIIATFAAALPLPTLKQFTLTNNYIYIVLALFLYIVLMISYIMLLKYYQMNLLYPILKIFSILIVVVAGIVFFNEKLNMYQIFGIILGSISIYLLSFK